MQPTPHSATFSQQIKPPSWIKRLANAAIMGLGAVSVAGLGAAAVQGQQAVASNLKAAQNYEPATSYTAPPRPTEVAFLGDSFTAGAGASSKAHRWTTVLAGDQGWLELNYGHGGTNYGTGRPATNAKSYADGLTDIIVSNPDIVVVSSAGNRLDADQVPGMKRTFQTLREKLPNTRIVATSPMFRAYEFPERLVDFGADVEREVEAVGGEYIDIGHPLLDRHEAIAKDGVHPNDLGHELLAEATREALGDAGITG